ncbi:MAG: hypothetical protein Q8O05_07595 [Chloroflexota bacterium]|nr:hypothetical protein [Chloroflexota bacterium]
MAGKELSARVAALAIERVAGRLADRAVKALMKASFAKQFAGALLRSFEEQVEVSA